MWRKSSPSQQPQQLISRDSVEEITRDFLRETFSSVRGLRLTRIRESSYNSNWVYHVWGTAGVNIARTPSPETVSFSVDILVDRAGNVLSRTGMVNGAGAKAFNRNIRS